MTQKCEVCGKSAQMGNSKVERGMPKYLGGNGRKTTGITRRQFKPNLQRIRVQEGGSVVRNVSALNVFALTKCRKPWYVSPLHFLLRSNHS
ncbi:MAG: L28 family ribosomal protein [Planctomycetaceae bacterium]